jgi:uncharacterized protein (TIGR03437 family)
MNRLLLIKTFCLLLALAADAAAATANIRVVDQAGQPVPSVTISYSYTATAPAIPGSGSVRTNSEGLASLAHPCGPSSGSCCLLTSAVTYTISLSGWQFSPAGGTVACGPGSSDVVIRGNNLVTVPAVVSAASYRSALATGMIVAMFGAELANTTATAEVAPLPTTLAGRNILLRDSAGVTLPAPLFFVSPQQINFFIPPELAEGQVLVTIRSEATALSSHFIAVGRVAPSLFTANADGQGIASGVIVRVTTDGAQNYEYISRYDSAQQRYVALPLEFRPATSFIVLALFGTGWRFRSAQTATSVTIGGVNAPVLYVGEQPTFIGLDQLNVELPRSLIGRGDADVVVTVDGKVANTVRINVK